MKVRLELTYLLSLATVLATPTVSTCYSEKNINNIPKGIALSPRRICDDDVTYDKRSWEY